MSGGGQLGTTGRDGNKGKAGRKRGARRARAGGEGREERGGSARSPDRGMGRSREGRGRRARAEAVGLSARLAVIREIKEMNEDDEARGDERRPGPAGSRAPPRSHFRHGRAAASARAAQGAPAPRPGPAGPQHGPGRDGHSPSPRSCSPPRRSCRQSPDRGAGRTGTLVPSSDRTRRRYRYGYHG